MIAERDLGSAHACLDSWFFDYPHPVEPSLFSMIYLSKSAQNIAVTRVAGKILKRKELPDERKRTQKRLRASRTLDVNPGLLTLA